MHTENHASGGAIAGDANGGPPPRRTPERAHGLNARPMKRLTPDPMSRAGA